MLFLRERQLLKKLCCSLLHHIFYICYKLSASYQTLHNWHWSFKSVLKTTALLTSYLNMTFSLYWQLLISHSLTLNLLQIITVTFVMIYISAIFIVCFIIFSVILIISWYFILTCFYWVYHFMWAEIIESYSSTYFLQYIKITLLSKWSFKSCDSDINSQNLQLVRAESQHHLLKIKNSKDKSQETVWDCI